MEQGMVTRAQGPGHSPTLMNPVPNYGAEYGYESPDFQAHSPLGMSPVPNCGTGYRYESPRSWIQGTSHSEGIQSPFMERGIGTGESNSLRAQPTWMSPVPSESSPQIWDGGILAGLQGAGDNRRLPLGGDGRSGRMGEAPGLAPGPHVDRKQLARGRPQPAHVPAGARGSGPTRLPGGALPHSGLRTRHPSWTCRFRAPAALAIVVVSPRQRTLLNSCREVRLGCREVRHGRREVRRGRRGVQRGRREVWRGAAVERYGVAVRRYDVAVGRYDAACCQGRSTAVGACHVGCWW